jgi:hypothetical protein
MVKKRVSKRASSRSKAKKKIVKKSVSKPRKVVKSVKKNKINYPKNTNKKQSNSKKGSKIFILITFIVLGGLASYYFKNIYVYSATGLVVLVQAILTITGHRKTVEPLPKKIVSSRVNGKYVTEFDKFYDFILHNKNVPIQTVAIKFKITKKQVEEWAKILEDSGLVKINYPLFGSPRLRCVR